jgi:hypothetical protein
MTQNNLQLNYKQPVVASDGNIVMINEQGIASLLFFQIRQQTDQETKADVVAAVRLTNLQELKQLQKVIGDTIKQHESREP